MIQMTRKNVTIYQSSDDQAPQLNTTAGNLRTLLEACLVTGYGDKPALGWEMPYSDKNKAVFKSKAPDATGYLLHIDNSKPRVAEITGYQSMTALNSGTNPFKTGRDNSGKFPFLYNSSTKPNWLLVGHEKAFWFFCESQVQSGTSVYLFFGDFPSYLAADKGNALLAHTYSYYNSDYLTTDQNYPPATLNDNNSAAFPVLGSGADRLSAGVRSYFHSRCIDLGNSFPDPITGGMHVDEIDIYEQIKEERILRGHLPGLYASAQDLHTLAEGQQITGFDLSEDNFRKICLRSVSESGRQKNYYLINTTAWLV